MKKTNTRVNQCHSIGHRPPPRSDLEEWTAASRREVKGEGTGPPLMAGDAAPTVIAVSWDEPRKLSDLALSHKANETISRLAQARAEWNMRSAQARNSSFWWGRSASTGERWFARIDQTPSRAGTLNVTGSIGPKGQNLDFLT